MAWWLPFQHQTQNLPDIYLVPIAAFMWHPQKLQFFVKIVKNGAIANVLELKMITYATIQMLFQIGIASTAYKLFLNKYTILKYVWLL